MRASAFPPSRAGADAITNHTEGAMMRRTSCLLLVLFLVSPGGAADKPVQRAESHFVETGSGRIHYVAIGEGDVILVVHGGPGLDHTYLLPQLADLAAGHRVVLYDQRATGLSEGEPDSSTLTESRFVSDLEAVRVDLGAERITLLGHSWGGFLAMAYALEHPRHVRSLILVSSMAAHAGFFSSFFRAIAARASREDSIALAATASPGTPEGQMPAAFNAYFRVFFRRYFADASAAEALTCDYAPTTAARFSRVYARFAPLLSTYDLRGRLRQLRCRALIVHGDRDPIDAGYAEELQRCIAGSRLTVLPGCGHFPFVERREEFARIVTEFLSGP
jgi:proline iminopeptidase